MCPAVMVIPSLLNLRLHLVLGLADGKTHEWTAMINTYNAKAEKINFEGTKTGKSEWLGALSQPSVK